MIPLQNDAHIAIGGGKDNYVTNNVLYDAKRYSVGVYGGYTYGNHLDTLLKRLRVSDFICFI